MLKMFAMFVKKQSFRLDARRGLGLKERLWGGGRRKA